MSVPAAPDRPGEGWWLDPSDPSLARYHDGEVWTEFVQPVDDTSAPAVTAGRRVLRRPPAPGQDQPTPELLAGPAPQPPVRGWWLDPEDPARIRFHDGERWTEQVGRSTAPRPGVPGYQGIFRAGMGRGGISLGRPLAPGSGRYFSTGQIYWLILAMIVGLSVFPAGFQVEGLLGVAMIAVGAACLYLSFGRLFVGAWKAGFRIPGFRRDSTWFERFLGLVAVGAMLALAWGLISGIVDPGEGRP